MSQKDYPHKLPWFFSYQPPTDQAGQGGYVRLFTFISLSGVKKAVSDTNRDRTDNMVPSIGQW